MSWILRIASYLGRQKKSTLWGIIAFFLLALGIIDYFTGAELTISLFYLFPISLASWSLGKKPGLITGYFRRHYLADQQPAGGRTS